MFTKNKFNFKNAGFLFRSCNSTLRHCLTFLSQIVRITETIFSDLNRKFSKFGRSRYISCPDGQNDESSKWEIRDISDTAFIVAAQRAIETGRHDALFCDPLAEYLVGARGLSITSIFSQCYTAQGYWSVVIRTVVIDELIKIAVSRGADTILNLGAGLDTRPYRMLLPSNLRWIEIDYPSIIDFKYRQLFSKSTKCKLERVKLNLRELSDRRRILSEIGSSSQHIVVLTEGVVPYFTIEEVALLADDIHNMYGVRAWIVDYLSKELTTYRHEYQSHNPGRPSICFAPNDWQAFFLEHGWKSTDVRYLADEGAYRNRPLPLPLVPYIWINLFNWLGISEPHERLRKLIAYMVLEPTL